MAIYTGVADANGDFNIPFSTNYMGGQKVTVTAEKDAATKTIELFAPSEVVGGGVIQFSGNMNNFPLNVGVITLTSEIAGVIQASAMRSTSSADNLFYSATGLVIQGAVTEIKDHAFSDWHKAILLTLPTSLTKIGQYCFQRFGFSATTDFGITLPNSVTTLSNYSFSYANMRNFDIGTGVTSIPQYCFSSTGKLTTFNFRNVTAIGDNAFFGSNIQTINLPNSITTLGTACFQSTKATEITLGSGITTIATHAFNQCTFCTKFTIGINVANILSNAIAGLTACNELICLPTTPPVLNANALTGLKSTCVIKVPSTSLIAYKTAANWSAHASKMVGV